MFMWSTVDLKIVAEVGEREELQQHMQCHIPDPIVIIICLFVFKGFRSDPNCPVFYLVLTSQLYGV